VPLALLAGCGGQTTKKRSPGPPEVSFVVVQASAVPVETVLAGRTAAFQTAEVRPQVSGLIERRLFTEGTIVRAGQPLYRIDPSLYRAAAAQASASLTSAQANVAAARERAARYKPLAQIQAVAQQDYTDAVAQARQAAASVAQAQAQLQTARINLRFTTVPAPITGRIGRSLATEGALVTASQTGPLAVIQRLDPIYVDIRQSSADLLALRRALSRGGAFPASATVALELEDGTRYAAPGRIEFAEVMVDEATGTVTLRARFPNPDGLLLPGMFVRAHFAQSVDPDAILVPQAAVSHDPRGAATVLVVGKGNTAELRTVNADRTQGASWVVTKGLKPGDKVIVEGTARAQPGKPVRAVPFGTPQRVREPGGGTAGRG